jgi:arabinose-5-phosphate isomerase
MRKALKILNLKRLGFLVIINNLGLTTGIFTDGDLKRLIQKKRKIENSKIKLFMTKNPFIVEENMLASEILFQMNKRKITNVCVFKKGTKRKTTGVIHIHNLLNNLK